MLRKIIRFLVSFFNKRDKKVKPIKTQKEIREEEMFEVFYEDYRKHFH